MSSYYKVCEGTVGSIASDGNVLVRDASDQLIVVPRSLVIPPGRSDGGLHVHEDQQHSLESSVGPTP